MESFLSLDKEDNVRDHHHKALYKIWQLVPSLTLCEGGSTFRDQTTKPFMVGLEPDSS